MAGQRMRRVDEAVREVLSDALGHATQGSPDRLRDRHRREDQR